jgi:hypothetical protein
MRPHNRKINPSSPQKREHGMKNRCAGFVVVLLSLLAYGVVDAKTDFHGVLHVLNGTGTIDSAYLIVPPDSLSYTITGWSTAQQQPDDTFDFPDSLSAWPQRVWLRGTASGFPLGMRIEDPIGHRWYSTPSMDVRVMFYGAEEPGVEEPRLAVGPPPHLAVGPSVVTGQMTVRLLPVGTGRQVVEIHNAVGNVVRSLDCIASADGAATTTWNREDDRGHLVPEGVYFCRYAAADVIAVRKVLVAH